MDETSQPHSNFILENACKQFSLETERLEHVYQQLDQRFQSLKTELQETCTTLYGKLFELNFMTHYLDTILNHMSQGILFIDSNGIITTCNQMAEKILDRRNAGLLFRPFQDSFADSAFGFSLTQALQNYQCPKRTHVKWTQPSGVQLELEIETSLVTAHPSISQCTTPFPCPAIQGLLILIRDLTEIRQLQSLTQHHDRLKDIGEMASLVAHEIRNPLGGIKGFASLLHQDLGDRPDLQQMASSIMEGTESLNRFVSKVLNYTRPFKPQFETQDLVSFLRNLLNAMQADANFQRIESQFETQLTALEAWIDPELLRSALLNLCVNAVQAMPNGGRLTIALESNEKQATIQIKDTGVGIAPEYLPKLFSLFFTTKEKGNGFGLAEVYKVIQAHQGTIEVESQVKQGTVFTIKMPLRL